MPSIIQLKTGTGSAVPSALVQGEVAINVDNGLWYYGSGSGQDVKKLESFTDITASGNISSSGELSALTVSDVLAAAVVTQIDNDEIPIAKLAEDAVTVTAGTGLTGGGSITLGGSATVNVIGGTGVTANANDVAIGQDVATTADVLFNHITASGNISSSGTIISENAYHKKIYDGTSPTETDTFIELGGGTNQIDLYSANRKQINVGYSAVYINPSQNDVDIRLSGDNNLSLIATNAGNDTVGIGVSAAQQTSKLHVGGDMRVTHITASGNISSSGVVAAATMSIGHGHGITNPEHALQVKGNISASAIVFGATGSFDVITGAGATPGLEVLGFISSSGTITAATMSIGPGGINPEHALQVKGNISASGTIYAEDLVLTDDLTVTDDLSVSGDLNIAADLVHLGDTNTKFTFGADAITLTAGGANAIVIGSSGLTTLTAGGDLDIGAHQLRAETFQSDVATGTAPFTVASTTTVTNLEAATVATIAGLAPNTATTQATQAAITTAANLVEVGDLDAGSITSGFTSIDVGGGAITTTGTGSFGRIHSSQISSSGTVSSITGSFYNLKGSGSGVTVLKVEGDISASLGSSRISAATASFDTVTNCTQIFKFHYQATANHASELYIDLGFVLDSTSDAYYHKFPVPYDGRVRRISAAWLTSGNDPGETSVRVRKDAGGDMDLDESTDIVETVTIDTDALETTHFDFSASFSKGDLLAFTVQQTATDNNDITGCIVMDFDTSS